MKIYHYHQDYKYFICEDVAEPSPLDPPGVWLIPAHATTLEPPSFEEGFIPLFINDSWEIVEDNRGVYYNTITFDEIYNDNPVICPENCTKEKPPEIPQGKCLKWDSEWIIYEHSEILETPNINYEELTPQEKLEKIGLSIDDLKSLLGLGS